MIDLTRTLAETEFPSSQINQCPYGYYEALRKTAPVFKLPHRDEFVVSSHEDIYFITRHPEIFSNRHSVIGRDGRIRAATPTDRESGYACGIVNSDPPSHTWKRKLAFEMFRPTRLREREAMIRAHANAQIDKFINRGKVEFVKELASPLPGLVVLSLFGLSSEHLEKTLEWSAYDGMGSRFNVAELQDAAARSILSVSNFMRELIVVRSENPGDDDLSLHIRRHVEHEGGLDLDSLVAETSQLFLGGTQTTKHLMTSLMMLLVRHPDTMETVRNDPSQLKVAIEEALRLESPVQFSLRVCLQDTEIRGVRIPAGAQILLLWGSANRDECVFTDPQAYDVTRANVKEHMAFGNGAHFCVGAALGRLETGIAFEEIFRRIRSLQFADGMNDFSVGPSVAFRAPERLFLKFT
jgi:cytochrome P450